MKEDIIEFYRTQSRYTDPGKYKFLYDDIPDDIPSLQKIIAGIRINYISDQLVLGYKAKPERLHELDSKTVEFMLSEILRLCDKDLFYCRPIDQRLVGTCRDSAILMCSILRYKKVPSRMRYGLSPSQLSFPNMVIDHNVCEYWNVNEKRWIIIETELTQQHLDFHRSKLNIDLCDLKYPAFEYVGQAISKMLNEEWERYEYLDQGLWFYRNILFRDIAFLNKEEVNIWDHWGIMLEEPKACSKDTLTLLTEISKSDQSSDEFCRRMLNIYKRIDKLQVPEHVVCRCPHHQNLRLNTPEEVIHAM